MAVCLFFLAQILAQTGLTAQTTKQRMGAETESSQRMEAETESSEEKKGPGGLKEGEDKQGEKVSPAESLTTVEEQGEELKKPLALQFFGYDFFRRVPTGFDPAQAPPAPAGYRLGPGDELQAVFWGPSGQESVYELVVDNQGMIYVSGAGTLSVTGLTVEEVTRSVLAKLRSRFPQLRGYVAVSKVRPVQVMVAGEVVRPGTHVLPGTATLMNAIVAAGGPTERGSMRNVTLKRGGKTVAKVDLYDYLIRGETAGDVHLHSGDLVFVPVVGSRVTVTGEVKRPAIYEIKGKARLSDLIRLAGGLAPEAYAARAQVRRVEEKERRVVLDVSVREALDKPGSGADPLLRDGDIVQILKVLEPFENVVWIEGQVARPGAYALEEGMSVRDLLERAQGLDWRKPVYVDRADLFRVTKTGRIEKISLDLEAQLAGRGKEILLKPLDRLVVYSTEEAIFVDETVDISGAVKVAGRYRRTEGMRVRDLIELAGGLLPEASSAGELARTSPTGKTEILKLNISGILSDPEHPDNLVLEDRDLVTIQQWGDYLRRPDSVKVEGELKNPGVYALSKENETLYDLIRRAGGLTEEAFPEGAIFLRQVSELFPEAQQNVVTDVSKSLEEFLQTQYELELAKHGVKPERKEERQVEIPASVAAASLEAGQVLAAQKGLKAVEELVEGLPEFAKPEVIGVGEPREVLEELPERRIAVNLAKLIATEGAEANIVLRPGDLLIVPKRPTTVAVVGAVVNPSNFPFEPERNVGFYVSRSGGYSQDANAKRVVVIKPSGEVRRAGAKTKVARGDIILVPPRPLLVKEQRTWWEKTQEVVRLIADTATTAFIISSLREVSK